MTSPGIHTITAADYHADPCEQPSLSASMAHILCTQSPAHAKAKHPRLNPDYAREDEAKFDIGQASHALLLEGRNAVSVVGATDWRTKEAKLLRDEARAQGQIPLLTDQWREVQAMVASTREQLDRVVVDPPLFTDGKPELTLVWEDSGVTCRSRLDWLRDDMAAIDDYKSTSRSANPESWSRTLFGIGADIQAAFYLRGLAAVAGAAVAGMAEFRWVVQETFPPYALSVMSLTPAALELADSKVEYALGVWRRCFETGEWPAYPTRVCYADLPGWMEAQWLEKEEREAA